jgi:pyridoxamine 5'-phosphate oxidase
VEKVTSSESEKYFLSRPVGARLSARASAQSSVVAGREILEKAAKAEKEKHGDNPPRPAHWGGYRVIPSQIEFWQGRENRLHDRLLYSLAQGAWKIARLAP